MKLFQLRSHEIRSREFSEFMGEIYAISDTMYSKCDTYLQASLMPTGINVL